MTLGGTLVHRAQSLKSRTHATRGCQFGLKDFYGQSKERNEISYTMASLSEVGMGQVKKVKGTIREEVSIF